MEEKVIVLNHLVLTIGIAVDQQFMNTLKCHHTCLAYRCALNEAAGFWTILAFCFPKNIAILVTAGRWPVLFRVWLKLFLIGSCGIYNINDFVMSLNFHSCLCGNNHYHHFMCVYIHQVNTDIPRLSSLSQPTPDYKPLKSQVAIILLTHKLHTGINKRSNPCLSSCYHKQSNFCSRFEEDWWYWGLQTSGSWELFI